MKAFCAVFLIGPLWRAGVDIAGLSAMAATILPMGCMDDLAGGGLVALAFQDHRGALSKVARWCGSMGLLGAAPHTLYWLWYGGPTMLMLTPLFRTSVALCFMGLLARLVGRPPAALGVILKSRPLVYVGTISYGIYIQHLLMPRYLAELDVRLPIPPGALVPYFVFVTACTLFLASASWHLFERPLNGLKRHFPYVRQRGRDYGTQLRS